MTLHPLRDRRARRLQASEREHLPRRLAREDVAAVGEQLAGLTSPDTPDDPDLRAAQEACRSARDLVGADGPFDRARAVAALDDARHHLACLAARRDGRAAPARTPPCFFDSRHGPSSDEVAFTAADGVERVVPACRADADRVAAGLLPQVRTTLVGGASMPCYAVEAALDAITAEGRPGATLDARAVYDRRMELKAIEKLGAYSGLLDPRVRQDLD